MYAFLIKVYPTGILTFFQDTDFEFADAVKQFDLVFTTLKAGRSLAASYNLQNDIQCELGLVRDRWYTMLTFSSFSLHSSTV